MGEKKLSVPGPGTYDSVKSLSEDGKYYFSRFHDSGSTALRSSAVRFTKENAIRKVPGPGQYDHPETIKKSGANFISRFGSSSSCKFSLARRSSTLDSKSSTFPPQTVL